MKIGVVSDTHNNLKNVTRIVELFNDANVERVVHTGDITQAKTLDVFAELNAPMWGVYGNNDQERDALVAAVERYGFDFTEPPLVLEWASRSIMVVHDPLEFDGHLNATVDLALHGHTHLHRFETRDTHRGTQVLFNPGECAGHMNGFNAIGVMDLELLDADLLKF